MSMPPFFTAYGAADQVHQLEQDCGKAGGEHDRPPRGKGGEVGGVQNPFAPVAGGTLRPVRLREASQETTSWSPISRAHDAHEKDR